MTYDEVMAILDQEPEKHFHEMASHIDNPAMAVLYVQTQTGCDKEIAQQIVYETIGDFPAPGSYIPPVSSTSTVTCPYCQSTDTKKISGTSRFVSTGLFGLASSKVGKQWLCSKCKSYF